VIGCDPTDKSWSYRSPRRSRLTVPVPISVPLSRKLTVPAVGAGPDAAVTVAVNVTDCPEFVFGLLDISAVVVLIAAAVDRHREGRGTAAGEVPGGGILGEDRVCSDRQTGRVERRRATHESCTSDGGHPFDERDRSGRRPGGRGDRLPTV